LEKNNTFGKNVLLSKDLIIASHCSIRDYTAIGKEVKLGKHVTIGRGAYLERISIGNNSAVETGVICTGYGSGKIAIGEESYIGIYCILDYSDNISIGNYVHIAGPSTGLWTHSSAQMCLRGVPLKQKDLPYRPTASIAIEDCVYIGGNCTIYPGVTIHHHAIVAPNSAVAKDVESYTMVGGVPAKFIEKIESSMLAT
jgi:acetyltransferase-like isoleucine patch superfamily enzyme